LFPYRIGECIAYLELGVGLGMAFGANFGYILYLLLSKEIYIFLFMSILYLLFSIPVLKLIP